MALDHPDLAAVTEADLQALITAAVPEGRDLDYKVMTYGGNDDSKREFLADVSAFANTAGGHLVIGMQEAGGVATALPGVALDPDAEIRRLDSLARDGLQPRILNIKFHAVPLATGGVAILVRVPKSWSAPHRVIAQRSNRFWARGAGGKYEPDVSELRSLFSVAPTIAVRVRDFRMERLMRIAARDTPVSIPANGALVLHVLPFAAFGDGALASIDELYAVHDDCRPMGVMGLTPGVNLDGMIITSGNDGGLRPAYVQVWKDGRIESVRTPLVQVREAERVVFTNTVETHLVEGVRCYMRAMGALNVPPPFVVLVGLVGTAGATLDRRGTRLEDYKFDRDLIAPSELICNDPPATLAGSDQAAATFLRPIFDEIANSAGRFRSGNFDAHGNWRAAG